MARGALSHAQVVVAMVVVVAVVVAAAVVVAWGMMGGGFFGSGIKDPPIVACVSTSHRRQHGCAPQPHRRRLGCGTRFARVCVEGHLRNSASGGRKFFLSRPEWSLPLETLAALARSASTAHIGQARIPRPPETPSTATFSGGVIKFCCLLF